VTIPSNGCYVLLVDLVADDSAAGNEYDLTFS
jgi:hypothetical protein